MNASDLIEILKYASKFEHPLFVGAFAGVIAYLLFRWFKNKEGRQNFEEQMCLYNAVRTESIEDKKEIAELKQQLSDVIAERDQWKVDFEILKQNKKSL